nr:DUF3182 family protein [uncultured Pseudomonas sp.]
MNDDARCTGKSAVVLLPTGTTSSEHEHHTQQALGIKIAKLLDCPFLGIYDPAGAQQDALYFIPSDTLIGGERYRALGIRSSEDFFGGLVGYPFMATKAITHPLIGGNARRPEGWSPEFARLTDGAVLRGYSVFSLDDGLEAGLRLLREGPLRLKPVRATGGRNQIRVSSEEQLVASLAGLDPAEIALWGLALEEDLQQVATYSVGQICIGGMTVSYYGSQRLTRNNTGEQVYGGSAIRLVRGGYDALLDLRPPDHIHLAIVQAQLYERAAFTALPGFMASRRNYDVAQGLNARGQSRSGVLEQSWRIGGASAAEILGLQALAESPTLSCVRASTHELYGDAAPPLQATMLYQGDDPDIGRISKFALVEPDVP